MTSYRSALVSGTPIQDILTMDPSIDSEAYREAFASVVGISELPVYLEWRSAAIALKAANLAAVAASERFKVALAKLAEAAAP